MKTLFLIPFAIACFTSSVSSLLSQSVTNVEVYIALDPVMLRVTGITSLGYLDRIEESIAQTDNDTAHVGLFFDWCALPGIFEVYDTTFALESTFPFHLCVTAYQDTLAIESPCESYNFEIDTGETVCLSSDQILDIESYYRKEIAKIYPNPTRSRLNLDLSEFQGFPITYSIMELTGSILMKGDIKNELEQIDVTQLPAGMLILELRNEKGVSRLRFVKLR